MTLDIERAWMSPMIERLCVPRAWSPDRSHVTEADSRRPQVSTPENQFCRQPSGRSTASPAPAGVILVTWCITPTRSVSRSRGLSTMRSTMPPNRSRAWTSGADSGCCSGLRPEKELVAGRNSPSSVSVLVGERSTSTRANDTMPLAPTAGVPDWVVTPGTGTRSKFSSTEEKKRAWGPICPET